MTLNCNRYENPTWHAYAVISGDIVYNVVSSEDEAFDIIYAKLLKDNGTKKSSMQIAEVHVILRFSKILVLSLCSLDCLTVWCLSGALTKERSDQQA